MLGDVCTDRNNGFNLLRLMAALGILYAHCALVIPSRSNIYTPDHSALTYGFDLLLALFFVFSGFLITASMERNQSLIRYATARALRIFPGLITVAIVLALVAGPFLSELGAAEYYGSLQTWNFIPQMAILVEANATLPGVFTNHPVPGAVDIPIWTLRYELVIYAAFPFLYKLCLSHNGFLRASTLAGLIGAIALTKLVPELAIEKDSVRHLLNFSASFLVGAAMWSYRNSIPYSATMVVLLWGLFALVAQYDVGFMVGIAASGYTFIYIAFLNLRPLKAYNTFGDYSYGTYILHFPVGQFLYQLNPGIDPLILAAQTASVTLPLAIAMWLAVEQPALSQIKNVEIWIREKLAQNSRAIIGH